MITIFFSSYNSVFFFQWFLMVSSAEFVEFASCWKVWLWGLRRFCSALCNKLVSLSSGTCLFLGLDVMHVNLVTLWAPVATNSFATFFTVQNLLVHWPSLWSQLARSVELEMFREPLTCEFQNARSLHCQKITIFVFRATLLDSAEVASNHIWKGCVDLD